VDSGLGFTLLTESASELLLDMAQGFGHFLADALVLLLSRFTFGSLICDLVS